MLTPVLPGNTFLRLEAGSSRPQFARVDTSPILIVNIRLSTLAEAGSPARVVQEVIEGYYPDHHTPNLIYIDAPYNIQGWDEAEAFKEELDRRLAATDG